MTTRIVRPNDFIPDLTPVEYHCVKDFCYDPNLPAIIEAIAIGWLGEQIDATGVIEPELLAAIRYAHMQNRVDEGWLGYHTCGICNAYDDRGEFIIQVAGKIYVMPRMLLHYIEDHSYCPPSEFLADVVAWWA